MVALAGSFLDDITRDQIRADLDRCIEIRREYRGRLAQIREREGESAWVVKLQWQCDRLTEWIDRYREALA